MRKLLMVIVASNALLMSLSPARAGTVEERCEEATDNGAAYRRCVAAEASKALSTLSAMGKDMVCNGTTCIHRLVYDKQSNKFVGKELSMEIKPEEAGRSYVIIDAKKRRTIYEQCGSCRSIEYGSGPLDDVSIYPDTDSAFMVTVRSRQR